MLTKLIKSRKGETLIEVLIAIMMLAIGAMGALRLLGVAAIRNELAEGRAVATNLAREGLEAVRSVRDTNWLRYAGERRMCWNNISTTECDGTDPIEHKENYIVEFDNTNYRWELTPLSPTTDRLDIGDGSLSAGDEEYRLKIDSDGLYNHTNGDDSNFFREIFVEYLNDWGNDVDDAKQEDANVMRVTSRVQWYDKGKISDVTLTTIFSDYLSRYNHD